MKIELPLNLGTIRIIPISYAEDSSTKWRWGVDRCCSACQFNDNCEVWPSLTPEYISFRDYCANLDHVYTKYFDTHLHRHITTTYLKVIPANGEVKRYFSTLMRRFYNEFKNSRLAYKDGYFKFINDRTVIYSIHSNSKEDAIVKTATLDDNDEVFLYRVLSAIRDIYYYKNGYELSQDEEN